jgi:hypothetical protein
MATETDTKKPEQATPSSSALALHQAAPVALATPYEMALEPHNFKEAMEIAGYMADIHYCGIASFEEGLARIMYGRTLGLTAMASLANVYTIENKPALESATMLGICLQNPICEYFQPVESSPKGATWKARRKGFPEVVVSFTIGDAENAKLLNRGDTPEKQAKNNWNRFPEDMCTWRAVSRLAKRVFPDLIRGFSTVEELRDERRARLEGAIDVEVEVTQPNATPAAVTNSAPSRDLEAETVKYEADCQVATTRAALDELRAQYKSFGDAEPFKSRMKKAYGEAVKRAKSAEAPEAPAADAPKEGA